MKYMHIVLILLVSFFITSCFEKESSDSTHETQTPTQVEEEVVTEELESPSEEEDEYINNDISYPEQGEEDAIEQEQAAEGVIDNEEETVEDAGVDEDQQAEIDKKQIIDDAAEDLEALFNNFE